jgi:hypothetical protein
MNRGPAWGMLMRLVWICILLALAPINSAVADMSWYLGAGGMITKIRTESFATSSGLNSGLALGGSAASGEFSSNPTAWQVYGAFMWTENFGVLVKYSDTGVAKDWWQGFRDVDGMSRQDYNFDGSAQMKGITLYAIQTIPVTDKLEYTIEAGWTSQDLDFSWASAWNPTAESFDDGGMALGAVVRYKFLKYFAVSGEFEYLFIDFNKLIEKPIRYGLNLEFHF